jgi:hypothetical protein
MSLSRSQTWSTFAHASANASDAAGSYAQFLFLDKEGPDDGNTDQQQAGEAEDENALCF